MSARYLAVDVSGYLNRADRFGPLSEVSAVLESLFRENFAVFKDNEVGRLSAKAAVEKANADYAASERKRMR